VGEAVEARVRIKRFKMATVRVEPEVWENLEILAAADKRPVANYLRVILSEVVAVKSGQMPKAA
jgi:predicted DNA-binding protein